MSDADIPSRFGPALRWVVAGIFLFVFALGISDSAHAGERISTAVYACLFIVTFVVAVKWDWLAQRVGERKVTMFYVGLAVVCAAGLGLALGKLMGRTNTAEAGTTIISPSTTDTGRIAWNFDQIAKGQANLLTLGRLNDGEIRVVGIGAHGRNTSNDPITEFKGYVRSDLTNARLPIFIMAEDPNAASGEKPNPFQPLYIPTRPEETYGIPGLTEFDIVTYENAVIQTGIDGVPLPQFLREFGSFTLVLEYDGIKVEHKFSREVVNAAVERFENSLHPQRTVVPRVTRRPNATPPVQSSLPFPPQQQEQPQQLPAPPKE